MDCERFREQMIDEVSGGTEAASSALSAHAKACAPCAAELLSLRKTLALLDEWQAPEPSPYFSSRIRAQVRDIDRQEAAGMGGWLSWLRKPALAAALSIAILTGGGLALFHNSTSGSPVSSIDPHGFAAATQQAVAVPDGSAVRDLKELDKDHDLYADFDLLDELQTDSQQAQTVNQ